MNSLITQSACVYLDLLSHYSNLHYLLLLACAVTNLVFLILYLLLIRSAQFCGISSSAKRGQFLVHHGCSSEPLGPPPPTIHYTLPRFILKDPGLQPLRNPQKQGAILDVMTNPKITLGLTRGG